MKPENPILAGLALVAGLLFLSPVLYSIWMSFQTVDAYYAGELGFTLDNYARAVGQYNFARYLLNSLIVSGLVTLLGITFATMAAYAFARYSFKGGNFLFAATVATLMIPSHISLIPNYLTLAKVGLLDSYAGLILPAISNGFAAFFLRQYIRGIPKALDEAAYMDGASSLQVLWRIIVPCRARPLLPWRSTSSSRNGTITSGHWSLSASRISTPYRSALPAFTASTPVKA
jgi:ABC-type glycerol-3-phosphate transport system permease component